MKHHFGSSWKSVRLAVQRRLSSNIAIANVEPVRDGQHASPSSKTRGGGRRLPNKGRHGCAANVKLRPGKFSQKPDARAKSAQKSNDLPSFHDY